MRVKEVRQVVTGDLLLLASRLFLCEGGKDLRVAGGHLEVILVARIRVDFLVVQIQRRPLIVVRAGNQMAHPDTVEDITLLGLNGDLDVLIGIGAGLVNRDGPLLSVVGRRHAHRIVAGLQAGQQLIGQLAKVYLVDHLAENLSRDVFDLGDGHGLSHVHIYAAIGAALFGIGFSISIRRLGVLHRGVYDLCAGI